MSAAGGNGEEYQQKQQSPLKPEGANKCHYPDSQRHRMPQPHTRALTSTMADNTQQKQRVKGQKMAKSAKPADGLPAAQASGGSNPNEVRIVRKAGMTDGEVLAEASLLPLYRHAALVSSYAEKMVGDGPRPSINESASVLAAETGLAASGDMGLATKLLTAQALTLDALFTDLARRAGINMGEYPQAAERYMRLALKAQANSRTTIEALVRLHQPREQTVRHVHVNEGGQAVIADQFHHHAGAAENGKSNDQSHTLGACVATLPSPDPCRNGVPISSGEGEAALQDARRN